MRSKKGGAGESDERARVGEIENTKRMEVDYLHFFLSLTSPFSVKVHADVVI